MSDASVYRAVEAAVLTHETDEGTVVSLATNEQSIEFKDPRFFPFVSQICRRTSFKAGEALDWIDDGSWEEVEETLSALVDCGVLSLSPPPGELEPLDPELRELVREEHVGAVNGFIAEALNATGALTALAAALDAKASSAPLESTLGRCIDDLLSAFGLAESVSALTADEAAVMLGTIRSNYLLDAKHMFAHQRMDAWEHDEPEILEGVGDSARDRAHLITHALVPECEGLAQRFEAGASVLDVGTGVAATALELVSIWPNLRIVGLEPWAPAIRLARDKVQQAGLDTQIELREQGVEALADESAYDFIHFANSYIREALVLSGLERCLRALRPGGWLSITAIDDTRPPQMVAMSRLRETQRGGAAWSSEHAVGVLKRIGFVDVQPLPGVGWVIVGRAQAD